MIEFTGKVEGKKFRSEKSAKKVDTKYPHAAKKYFKKSIHQLNQ